MKYTITEISGRQFWIELGKYYFFNNMTLKSGKKVFLQRTVILNNKQKIKIGKPYLAAVKIKGKILEHFRGTKTLFYKMTAKKKTRRKKGHRQKLSRVLIEEIFTQTFKIESWK